MPTLASGEPHRQRDVAESFGSDTRRYDRARPGYPAAMVERILAAAPGPDLLDVGIGTGIAARQFRAAGCHVLGVDPDERMVAAARRDGFAAEVARFEDWAPAGRTFDAVVSGQTWHWVDPVAGAAQAARVLRPGGLLALFWNVFDAAPEVAAAFAAVHRELTGPLARLWSAPAIDGYAQLAAAAADGVRTAGGFGEPAQWRYEWERPYTRDEWLDQLPTQGGYARLPDQEQATLLAGIGAAIDRLGGAFTMTYTTVVVVARRD
ncbi:class I SAM-dependent methyltransferase [Jiangella anatolica]|uniref:SAM-dependent methyltransferase n=1 Tax=Jiangella anatolica TaxID=2670374 RepID=A0A2W2BCS0_9ACTN|nr:class I SAM-dependent methyltransferase [Jiangella anatolica]PZF83812.1 SAM-dependent methyltransferase [Jiangella anatolica]